MEVTKMTAISPGKNNKQDDDQEVMLPGFRFHPTDEELVGFYLRRKVEKKPIRIDIIKQADIYKYDPWDLPRVSTVGDKEWYFFCMRGRKYRNSIRPNRVTGSGFWKATGIDKAIHSMMEEPNECIGLKKSLVYYRGSAGKGTKTDWMMHEFRLPPNGKSSNLSNNVKLDITQEAEVWTLCRIFKRTSSNKKYTPNWKDSSTTALAANAIKHNASDSNSKTCSSSLESETSSEQQQQYMYQQNETKPFMITNDIGERNHLFMTQLSQSPYSASYNSSFWNPISDNFLTNGNWDELGSVVELAIDPSHVYDCR